jgi:DNA-binding winged helix-turn-helix (wHTH) protein/tetratricopeptide (TPR) repeat protein
MRYRWNDYSLDREGTLLTRQGQQVDVSRKVLDCITHLVEYRDRVVGYDELVRKVWGHENVTNHQLSQVILAARRALGDDGQAQRLIRTMPGLGYRWVGVLCEPTDTNSAPKEQAGHALSPIPSPPASPVHTFASTSRPELIAAPWYRKGKPHPVAAVIVALILAAMASIRWQPQETISVAPASPASGTTADSISSLWDSLWKGQFEAVRSGLAALPSEQADSPDARLLEIHLDIQRGRFDRATEKLALQQVRALAAADPLWQAKLLTTQTLLNGSAGATGAEVLAPAQSAVVLLESMGDAASPQAMGESLSARGYGYMKTQQFEPAMRDLVHARDLLAKAGDKRGAANAADTLARILMRLGRFTEALELLNDIATYCQTSQNPVQEIYARNAATKIQIELLRWDGALASSDRSMQLLRTVPDSERKTRVLQLRGLVLAGLGRLREASSSIEETVAMHDHRYSPIAAATYRLASGNARQALAAAAEADGFEKYNVNDDLNLESREGALLLWTTAAQALAAQGEAMPAPSPSQLAILQRPESTVGHIARGRWLWSQKPSSASRWRRHVRWGISLACLTPPNR